MYEAGANLRHMDQVIRRRRRDPPPIPTGTVGTVATTLPLMFLLFRCTPRLMGLLADVPDLNVALSSPNLNIPRIRDGYFGLQSPRHFNRVGGAKEVFTLLLWDSWRSLLVW